MPVRVARHGACQLPQTHIIWKSAKKSWCPSIQCQPCLTDKQHAEIKADEKGLEDYGGQILRLKQRREFLKKRVDENQAWAANYDKEFGPFVAKYREFMEQMDRLYKQAKVKHADGLKLLMQHFAYHPEFKRWSDTFSAVPFRPL